MFGQNREKKRFSWRWAVLLVALVAGSLLLVACGDSDPSPTATTEPTSVQATPDEDGDAMMDEDGDAMMPLSDIDETTTGAELIASLSEGEADCLRAAIGDASYEAMQDLTLSESAMGFDTFPLQCLEPGNAIDLSVAMMSLQAGGLSDDSRACIKDVFADLGVPGEGMSMTDSMRSLYNHAALPDRRRSASHVGTCSGRRRISFALPTTLRIRADRPGEPVHRLPGLCRPGVEHGATHTIAGNDEGGG